VLYGVAMVSRIDKIIGLFCRILSLFQGSFAKATYDLMDARETYDLTDATKQSQHI